MLFIIFRFLKTISGLADDLFQILYQPARLNLVYSKTIVKFLLILEVSELLPDSLFSWMYKDYSSFYQENAWHPTMFTIAL